MQKPNRAAYTASEFLDWAETQALVLTPKFQRRGVWQEAAKSFFIDTLLREMPVPPIYIRLTQSTQKNRVVREVIDGQQRLTALIQFMRGEFALSKNLVAPWRGKTFSHLSAEERKQIEDYSFSTETFQGIPDQEILEIFSRLNTYSVPLNQQELRNGKFFGEFKQLSYKIAHQYLEFWRENRIFTERGIARMEEVETVSELLIVGLAGMQDKKKSIDTYYERYDETFRERDSSESHFDKVMNTISAAFSGTLGETEFHRPPLFYTLYAVVHHRIYGVPGITFPRNPSAIKAEELQRLTSAVVALSAAIEDQRNEEAVPDNLLPFVVAAQRQTDNLRPRQVRFDALYARAFP
jgi:hypothetical protein